MADSAVRKEDSGDEGQGPSPSQLTLLQRLQSSLLRDDPDSGMAGNPGAHMQQPAQMSVNPHPDHVTQVRMLVQQLKESLSVRLMPLVLRRFISTFCLFLSEFDENLVSKHQPQRTN